MAVPLLERRYPLVVLGLTALVVALFWAAIWVNYEQVKASSLASAEADGRKVLRSFQDHSTRILETGDLYLRAVRRYVVEHDYDPADVAAFVEMVGLPQEGGEHYALTMTDADGRLIYRSEDAGVLGTDISSRSYFQALKHDPTDRLIITPTDRGKVSGELRFRLVRPLRDPKGEFRGVLLLTMRPQVISAFYRQFDLGSYGSTTMLTLDRRLIAREPQPVNDTVFDHPVQGTRLWDEVARSPEGAYRQRSVVDEIDRLYLYKVLDNYPVLISVGLADEDLLLKLLPTRLGAMGLALGFLVVAAGFSLLLLRMDSRNQALAEAEAEARSRRMADHLEAQTRALQRSNEDLEQFAYVASHDLQEPLRTITTYVQLLERRYWQSLDGDGREFANYVVQGTHRMADLINDLLAYARIGVSAAPRQPLSAQVAVDETLRTLRGALDEADALVSIGPMPRVMLEPMLLVSLFQNLVSNAVKYRDPARPLEIAISAEPLPGNRWHFKVADTGIGIEPTYFGKIFVIFQRLHPYGEYNGTGIGLALCKRIVDRAGGEIWVESEPGKGSVFHFVLPGEPESDQAPGSSSSS